MAGGMKVAVSPAVGAGPWGWEAGGGGAVLLLLVLSGCLVCGSGTARAAAAKGAGAKGVIFRKGGNVPRRGGLLCSGAGVREGRNLVVG